VFRIKKEQMEFFNEKTRLAFRRRMTTYLRESFAECVAAMSDAALDEWVDDVLRRAEKHRVRAEPDVAQLMLLFLLLGSDADERIDWVTEALSNRNLSRRSSRSWSSTSSAERTMTRPRWRRQVPDARFCPSFFSDEEHRCR
jgi:hypothetical protein